MAHVFLSVSNIIMLFMKFGILFLSFCVAMADIPSLDSSPLFRYAYDDFFPVSRKQYHCHHFDCKHVCDPFCYICVHLCRLVSDCNLFSISHRLLADKKHHVLWKHWNNQTALIKTSIEELSLYFLVYKVLCRALIDKNRNRNSNAAWNIQFFALPWCVHQDSSTHSVIHAPLPDPEDTMPSGRRYACARNQSRSHVCAYATVIIQKIIGIPNQPVRTHTQQKGHVGACVRTRSRARG